MTDTGCNLFSLDLRNGQVLCGYKGVASVLGICFRSAQRVLGLSGAVTSIASSPTFMASVALDRFTRIHSTPLPPQEVGQQVDRKGDVLEKVYMKTTSTVIIWDGEISSAQSAGEEGSEDYSDSEDEAVWDGMEDVRDSDEEDGQRGTRRKTKKSKAG